ncbi:MAG TPA: TatD family hydrolase [Spirochaetota bacterium]
MRIIDAHCHLQADVFKNDLHRIVAEGKAAGIEKFISSATSPSDWQDCRNLQQTFPECSYSLGIHPWYIPPDALDFLSKIKESDLSGAVAIGEIGLDKRFTDINFETQLQTFRKQLRIAADLRLPVIMHCIRAWNELVDEIKKVKLTRGGIVHNFNGGPDLARSLTRYGISFSVGGTATYRDSNKRAEMIRSIFPDRILLETDSPDIPPAEKRGLVNEPSYIRYTLSAISDIIAIDEETIAEKTTENAEIIFFS